MATRICCDGTGVPIPTDTPTTGFLGHQYCDEARPIAEEYLSKVDTIHTECAQTFQSRLAALRKEYHEHLLQLPDESEPA